MNRTHTLALASLLLMAPAQADPLTNSMIQRWQYAHPVCKGTAADLVLNDPSEVVRSDKACLTRNAITKELKRRGWCLILTPNGADEYAWRPCHHTRRVK